MDRTKRGFGVAVRISKAASGEKSRGREGRRDGGDRRRRRDAPTTHPSLNAGTAFSRMNSSVALAADTVAGTAVSSTNRWASWQLRRSDGIPFWLSQLYPSCSAGKAVLSQKSSARRACSCSDGNVVVRMYSAARCAWSIAALALEPVRGEPRVGAAAGVLALTHGRRAAAKLGAWGGDRRADWVRGAGGAHRTRRRGLVWHGVSPRASATVWGGEVLGDKKK